MEISIVVAIASNGVIGREGGLPWRLPADLAHFKAITMGKPIVMGRLTHESIGRPLPGRENIVVSRSPAYQAQGCRVVQSLNEVRDTEKNATELMIIGGARLYAESLSMATRLYLTEVHAEPEGDVYFPDFDRQQWQELDRKYNRADRDNEYDYSFVTLSRNAQA